MEADECTKNIDTFQKWLHVMSSRELEDTHQNKSYASEDRFNLELFAQW